MRVYAVMAHPENTTSYILDVYSDKRTAWHHAENSVENGDVEVYEVETPDETENNQAPEPSKKIENNSLLED
jgi:hypothetical protein